MAFIYGAIAEGWFDVGWLDSLGRGGVDRNGQLREKACSSQDSARKRALRAVANRLRYKRGDGTAGVEFKDLDKNTQKALLDEVDKTVRWQMIGPTLSRGRLDGSVFANAMKKAVA